MLETFLANLHDFQPNLILISGLHMLDGQEPDFFEARLDALVAGLNKVDRGIPVHLEFASMVDRNFMRAILEKVSLAYLHILHAVKKFKKRKVEAVSNLVTLFINHILDECFINHILGECFYYCFYSCT